MKRSRLVLSTSYFGTGRPKGVDVSEVARETRADDIAFGSSLDAGDPKRFRADLTARHLQVVAAENVWATADVDVRYQSGKALASADSHQREVAIRLAVESVENVRAAGGRTLIVRLGEMGDLAPEDLEDLEAAVGSGQTPDPDRIEALRKQVGMAKTATLDRACRSLHEVLRRTEQVSLAIVPGDPLIGIVSPETLGWILDDLKSARLGYWHDPVIGHRWERLGLHEIGSWLDQWSKEMKGVFLHDFSEGTDRLPPGLGEIDLRTLSTYVPESALRVVLVDGRGGLGPLVMAFKHLRDMGFE